MASLVSMAELSTLADFPCCSCNSYFPATIDPVGLKEEGLPVGLPIVGLKTLTSPASLLSFCSSGSLRDLFCHTGV